MGTNYLGAALASQAVTAKAKPLTAEQRKKVESLMVDEGESCASAVAWVRAFEGEADAADIALMDEINDTISREEANRDRCTHPVPCRRCER